MRIHSIYTPITYNEWLAPVLAATQAHQKLEEQLGDLNVKAGVWEQLANEQNDPETYAQYKNYANDLKLKADELAEKGLQPGSRQGYLDMKIRYSKEITPIEQAYAHREEERKEQRKALLDDSSMLYSRNAFSTSLDDYVKNPALSYESVSGKLLMQQSGQAATSLAKTIYQNPRKWRSILGGQYYETLTHKGLTDKQVLATILRDKGNDPELRKILDDVFTSSGIPDWDTRYKPSDTDKRAWDYINTGAWAAIGGDEYQNLANRGYEAELGRQGNNNRATRHLPIDREPLYSKREFSDNEKKYRRIVNNYEKYFVKLPDGTYKLTTEGLKAFNEKATRSEYVPGGNTINVKSDKSDFYYDTMKLLNDAGIKSKNGKVSANDISTVFTNFVNNDPSKMTAFKDVWMDSRFGYTLDNETQKTAKTAILEALGRENLKEADYNPKEKKYVPTGHELNKKDLSSDDYTVIKTYDSPYGKTVSIKDKDGEVRDYMLPRGVHFDNETNIDRILEEIPTYWENAREMRDAGLEYSPDWNALEERYFNLLDNLTMFQSQRWISNKTEPTKYEPYGY